MTHSIPLPRRAEPTELSAWSTPAYVIAEAGVNHGGDLEVALEMVRAAAGTGIDAVKFQTYRADRLATRTSRAYWDRSKEPSESQFELFAKYDRLGEEDYRSLAEECARFGLDFLTTPFDVESVEWLDDLLPYYKVASADITNVPLLRRIGQTAKPVFLSTGAATIGEIEEAVGCLREQGCPAVVLLHCTLSYPTSTADASIGSLVHLRAAFPDCPLGYSDHTLTHDSIAAISAAYTLGARVVEKHYTLDKTQQGNDHWHAFDPDDFRHLVQELERLRELLGEPKKRVLDSEQPARLHARRSLVARGGIVAGEVIRPEHLDVKRPGTGIEPRHFDALVGRRASRDIADDTTLTWDMLEPEGAQADAASL